MSMCRVFSCCWKRVFAMISAFSWQNSLVFALLHSVFQGQICLGNKPCSFSKKKKVKVAGLCPAFCVLMGCSPPGSSVQGILQARILEWVAIPFSRGSSQSRDWTWGLLHCGQILYHLSHQESPSTLHALTQIHFPVTNPRQLSFPLCSTSVSWC